MCVSLGVHITQLPADPPVEAPRPTFLSKRPVSGTGPSALHSTPEEWVRGCGSSVREDRTGCLSLLGSDVLGLLSDPLDPGRLGLPTGVRCEGFLWGRGKKESIRAPLVYPRVLRLGGEGVGTPTRFTSHQNRLPPPLGSGALPAEE